MLDEIDLRILSALQADSDRPISELAEIVGLSQTPCWRRVRALKEQGYIRAQVALLDAALLNVGVTVFVAVRTSRHDADWFETFARAVDDIPEVVSFYRMSGDVDYLLRVVVPDIAAYDAVYQRLISRIDLFDVSSSFAMEELKNTTALPLAYAPRGAGGRRGAPQSTR